MARRTGNIAEVSLAGRLSSSQRPRFICQSPGFFFVAKGDKRPGDVPASEGEVSRQLDVTPCLAQRPAHIAARNKSS